MTDTPTDIDILTTMAREVATDVVKRRAVDGLPMPKAPASVTVKVDLKNVRVVVLGDSVVVERRDNYEWREIGRMHASTPTPEPAEPVPAPPPTAVLTRGSAGWSRRSSQWTGKSSW